MIERVNKLQGQLEANGIDGLLVTKRENIRYLSGFTGSSGVLVITAQSRASSRISATRNKPLAK